MMFAEGLYIGFYWGPRSEGLDVCTKQFEEFFHQIANLDPLFTTWYKDFGERELPLSVSNEIVRDLLIAGQTYPDVGKKPMHRLGYSANLYNSSSVDSFVKLSLQCDCIVEGVSNRCLVQAIAGTSAHDNLARIPLLMDLCRLIIDFWNPDRGIVSCNTLKEKIDPETMGSNCGWIMYQTRSGVDNSALPETAQVETIPDRGHLVVASEDISIPPTQQAIEDVRAVYEILGRAKLQDHT